MVSTAAFGLEEGGTTLGHGGPVSVAPLLVVVAIVLLAVGAYISSALRPQFVAVAGAGAILFQGSGSTAENVDGALVSREDILSRLGAILAAESPVDPKAAKEHVRKQANALAFKHMVERIFPGVPYFMLARTLRCPGTAVNYEATIRTALFAENPGAEVIVDVGTGLVKVAFAQDKDGTVPTEMSFEADEFNALLEHEGFPVASHYLNARLAELGVDLATAVVVGTERLRQAGVESARVGSTPENGLLAITVITPAKEAELVDTVLRKNIADFVPSAGLCVGTVAWGGGSLQGVRQSTGSFHRPHAVKDASRVIAEYGSGQAAEDAFALL
jgi:hypothetical protein